MKIKMQRLIVLIGALLLLNTLSLGAFSISNTVTFADQAGASDNDSLPASNYSVGLPVGVTAQWDGWLLHTVGNNTPMSVFPASDQTGNDATIAFSKQVMVSSFDAKDTGHGSLFSVMGYRAGIKVWHYDGAADNIWQTVTVGEGITIDTLVVEGRWNHIDNISLEAEQEEIASSDDIVLTITQPNSSLDELELNWPGTIGFRHQLQFSTNLAKGSWQDLGTLRVGIGDTNSMLLDVEDLPTFFRVSAQTIPADEVNAETGVATHGLPTPPAGYSWAPNTAFTDEFSGGSLDLAKWQYDHPYWNGREPSTYVTENVSVENGNLRIRNSLIHDPSTVADPNSDVWVGAGCVTSAGRSAWYGYYEAKVKAANICMTSAFWFQGKYSEIDVVEQMGVSYNNPYKESWMAMNTHYYPKDEGGWNNDRNTPVHWTMPTPAADEYHVYGVWWKDADNIWMYHNGVKVAEIIPGGSSDEQQYMFFDTEVFTWEGLPTVASLQDDTLNSMYVDWVRGWELVPD